MQAEAPFDLAILCGISHSFPWLSPAHRYVPIHYSPVRHSTHSRRSFLVRLACVKHAASVRSDESLSLFENNRIKNTKQHNSLFSASILCFSGKNYDVRIKVNSNGAAFQWYECSCDLNRKNNKICQHIAALVLLLTLKSLKKERRSPHLFFTNNQKSFVSPCYLDKHYILCS